jgi:hypothetical protein
MWKTEVTALLLSLLLLKYERLDDHAIYTTFKISIYINIGGRGLSNFMALEEHVQTDTSRQWELTCSDGHKPPLKAHVQTDTSRHWELTCSDGHKPPLRAHVQTDTSRYWELTCSDGQKPPLRAHVQTDTSRHWELTCSDGHKTPLRAHVQIDTSRHWRLTFRRTQAATECYSFIFSQTHCICNQFLFNLVHSRFFIR